MNELYVVKKISRKEGKEPFTYVQMYLDLGYSKLNISMDKNAIAEILGVAVKDLFSYKEDQPVLVGKFVLKNEVK